MPTIPFCDFGWFWKIKDRDFRRPLWKNGSNNLYEKIAQEVAAILSYYKSQILWSYDKNFVLNPKLLISPTNAYLTIYRVSKWMYVWLWTQVFKEKFTSSVSGKFSMHPMLRSEDLGGNVKRTTKKGGLELFWKRPNFPETLKFF